MRTLLLYSFFFLIIVSSTTAADSVWTELSPHWVSSIAQTSNGDLYITAGFGIEKSTDAGQTWQAITDSSLYQSGFDITVNPVTDDIFVAVESGVYRSSDAGGSWTYLADSLVGAYELAARKDGLMVTTGSPGIWISTDNGDSWQRSFQTVGPLFNGITFSDSGTIFAATQSEGVVRSADDGATWQAVASQFGDADAVMDVVADTLNGFVYATAFHQFFEEPTYNKIFRSADDGLTWVQVDSVSGTSTALGVDNAGNVYSGRIPCARSLDHGSSWIDISSGVEDGNRLMGFIEVSPGRVILVDLDGPLKVAEFNPPPSCCQGVTGNISGDAGDSVDLTDLTLLVNNLFVTFAPLDCAAEANTNGDLACQVTLSDLTILVNHLFVTFEPLASCLPVCN